MTSEEFTSGLTPAELMAYNFSKAYGLLLGASLVRQEVLQFNATHDQLTELLNRKALESYLRDNQLNNNVILYVDGTNVKAINDKLGHDEGDKAIQLIADVLKKSLRTKDDEDLLFRVGGDEFVAILSNIQRKPDELTPQAKLDTALKRIFGTTQSLLEQNPTLLACGFDIAVGGAIAEPGMIFEQVTAVAEQHMMTHKDGQHEEHGSYR